MVENFCSCHTSNKWPTNQIPWYRYETLQLFLGRETQGVGPEIYEQVCLPPSCQTPSPAPFGQPPLEGGKGEEKGCLLISHSSDPEMGTLTSPWQSTSGKLRKTEPKRKGAEEKGNVSRCSSGVADKASEVKTWVPQGLNLLRDNSPLGPVFWRVLGGQASGQSDDVD